MNHIFFPKGRLRKEMRKFRISRQIKIDNLIARKKKLYRYLTISLAHTWYFPTEKCMLQKYELTPCFKHIKEQT
jgi:hypothetical protein